MTLVTSSSLGSLAKLLLPSLMSRLQLHIPMATMTTTSQTQSTTSDDGPASFPERPKRPLSPYVKFMQEKITQEGKSPQLAGLSVAKMNQIIVEQYKALSKEQRDASLQQYMKELAEYALKKKAWVELMEENGLMKKNQVKEKEESLKKAYRKALQEKRQAKKELGLPTQTRTCYALYIMDTMKENPSQLKEGDNSSKYKSIIKRYKTLLPAQKEALQNRQEEDRKRYRSELAEWTEKNADKAREWAEVNAQVKKALKELHQASLYSPTARVEKSRSKKTQDKNCRPGQNLKSIEP